MFSLKNYNKCFWIKVRDKQQSPVETALLSALSQKVIKKPKNILFLLEI